MRRRNAKAFRRADSAKAEPEGCASIRAVSMKPPPSTAFGAEMNMCMLDEIRAKRDEIYAIARRHKAEKLWGFGSCARREGCAK